MLSRIAISITDYLIRIEQLTPDDRDLYIYGFFLLVSHTFYLLVTLFAGMLFDIVLESVVFYSVFMVIRKYAGGIHAKKEIICTLLTTISIFVSIGFMRHMYNSNYITIPLMMLLFGCMCILCFSPLDSEEKPLNSKEIAVYRKASIRYLILFFFAFLMAFRYSCHGIVYAIACGIFLEGILLLTGSVNARPPHQNAQPLK